MNPNDPLVPKIEFGEVGDDNRATVTIEMVPTLRHLRRTAATPVGLSMLEAPTNTPHNT